MVISIGEQIPDISLPATSGKTISLRECIGKPLVLYFYPRDNTPGCAQEGQDFRDQYAEFQAIDAEILGVSRDTVRKHENFKAKYEFPFELLADTEETLCDAFDIVKPKTMFGKPVRGIVRSTFLFDKAGILRQEWRKVKIEGHVAEVLATVKAL